MYLFGWLIYYNHIFLDYFSSDVEYLLLFVPLDSVVCTSNKNQMVSHTCTNELKYQRMYVLYFKYRCLAVTVSKIWISVLENVFTLTFARKKKHDIVDYIAWYWIDWTETHTHNFHKKKTFPCTKSKLCISINLPSVWM